MRILIVEDNPLDARLVELSLSEVRGFSFHMVRKATLGEAVSYLENEAVDVILLDLDLPDSSGLETLVRCVRHAKNAAVVVLTGFDDDRIAAQCVRMGAQEFLAKGVIPGNLLVRTIRSSIVRAEMARPVSQDAA